ncbi:TPA: HipA domain-containing protein [Vibrio alginolyticus]
MEYPIFEVHDQNFDDFEDMGTKSKFWYTDPSDKKQYLFKSTHTEDKNGAPVIRCGEDWAEKISCELAEALGIPHAQYDLASHNGEMGTRSLNFSVKGDKLYFGNHLLERVEQSQKLEPKTGQKSQEVSRVALVMEKVVVKPPRTWENTTSIKSALDVFIGYLMFDCLISNQDRHNENWALTVNPEGKMTLAPTFDHAASLGRNESDENRKRRLYPEQANQSVEQYVRKSKSHFYLKGTRLKTIEAFTEFAKLSPKAAIEWVERLEKLECDQVNNIVSRIPHSVISETAKQFCIAIIESNKKRIIDLKPSLALALKS